VRVRVLCVTCCALAFGPAPAACAQHAACTPVPAARGATFAFGTEGGNLRPRRVEIFADGRVTAEDAGPTTQRLTPNAVAALARQARAGGFWALRAPAITRPPRNPDVARRFIVADLTCGTHRAEYAGDAPAAFTRLLARLDSAVAH